MITDRRAEELLQNEEALDRLRKNFYHLWKPLMEARRDPTKLDEWRRAPRGSVGWRNLIFYEQAIRVLETSARE